MKQLLLFFTVCVVLSCEGKDDRDITCTDNFVFGLNVTVVDANSQEAIIENITVSAVDDDYTEELMLSGNTFTGAGERPGDYTITVIAEGYDSLTTEAITVEAEICHVIPEVVELRLFPN